MEDMMTKRVTRVGILKGEDDTVVVLYRFPTFRGYIPTSTSMERLTKVLQPYICAGCAKVMLQKRFIQMQVEIISL